MSVIRKLSIVLGGITLCVMATAADVPLHIRANTTTVDPDGTLRLSGDVVLVVPASKFKVSSSGTKMTIGNPQEGWTLEGGVRIEIDGRVVTTEKAVISWSEPHEIKMDEAVVTQL